MFYYKLLKLLDLLMFFVVGLVCYFSGVWGLVRMRKHLLVTLLSLEYIVLVLFFFIRLLVGYLMVEGYILLFFLVFSVCEGALGLSLMVILVRSHGRDVCGSYNLLEC